MSARPILYIGNKRYSSWSLRAWLVLKHAGIEADEKVVPLDTPGSAHQLAEISPVARVPVLVAAPGAIADSLAIAEWAAEQAPELWPSDPAMRARARVHAAAMHADFADLRREAPMNLGRDGRARELSEAARRDMLRIEALWLWRSSAGAPEARSEGPFMFGAWSIADAFWTPIATRVRSYALPVGPASSAYVDTLLADPHYRAWRADALGETYPNPLNDDV